MKTNTRIGIDLGGTKVEAILINKNGTEIARERLPTPQGDYRGILNTIVQLVDAMHEKADSQPSIGIGTPGSIGFDGLLHNSNSTCLNGRPFATDISRLLKQEIRIENDANCFTLSESVDGAAAGYKTVFGVILGTGIGGGLVFNSSLHKGHHRIGGEWGHNILRQDGPQCWCGNFGCVETFISGPALISQWQGGSPPEGALGLYNLAILGNSQATQIIDTFLNNLAIALANVINILDPDVIVIGGGLSNILSIYEIVPGLISQRVFSTHFRTPILQNLHGDSSGVRGAAWLWGLNE
ncbi:MAG: ROK family protein [Proteobacteria bacterium]|jgi:fructokinase|nr:ROK family protein [Pseudomonadota bacterium]